MTAMMEQISQKKEMEKDNSSDDNKPEVISAMDILRATFNESVEGDCDLIDQSLISCNYGNVATSIVASPEHNDERKNIDSASTGSNNSSRFVSPIRQTNKNSFEETIVATNGFRTPDRAKSALEQLAAIVTSNSLSPPSPEPLMIQQHNQITFNDNITLDDEIPSKHNDSSTANDINTTKTTNIDEIKPSQHPEQFYDASSSGFEHAELHESVNNSNNRLQLVEEVSKKLDIFKLEKALNQGEESVIVQNVDIVVSTSSSCSNQQKEIECSNLDENKKIDNRISLEKQPLLSNDEADDVKIEKLNNKHESDEEIQNLELRYKMLIQEITQSHKQDVQNAAENAIRIEQEKHGQIMQDTIQRYENTILKITEEKNLNFKQLRIENDKIQDGHNTEIDQMARDIDELESDFNKKTESLQTTMQQKDMAIRELSKQLADLNEKEYILETKLEQNQHVLNESNEEIKDLHEHVQDLMQALHDEKADHCTTKDEFESKKRHAIEKITLDLKKAAESQFNEANLIYMNLLSSYEVLKEEYDSIKNTLECEKMKVELVQKEKKALEGSKNGVAVKLKAATQRYASELQLHIEHKAKLEDEKEILTQKVESNEMLIEKITILKDQIAKENAELNSLCEELMTELETRQQT